MAVEGPPPAKFQTSEFDITTEKVMKMDMIDRYTDILYIYIHMQQSRKQNKICEYFDDVM